MDSLTAYIPIDRRWAMGTGQTLPDRDNGAALFIDFSGFTRLTDDLVIRLGDRRGADELTSVLNTVYGALIAEVHRYGGSVISFSGDAVTCWFGQSSGRFNDRPAPNRDTDLQVLKTIALRATACALTTQRVMEQFAAVKTPSGVTMSLEIKAGVAVGPARRFLVGDPEIQFIDVLAGATLDRMADAEELAQKKEVVLGPEAIAILRECVAISEWRRPKAESDQRFAVVSALTCPVETAPWPVAPFINRGSRDTPRILSQDQIRPWLLPHIYERLTRGQDRFLAELRRTNPLFILFEGIDYDQDDEAGPKLDAYVRWVQQVLTHYGGYLIQLTSGDKGTYLYACFGAPLTHDDNAARAIAAAIMLRSPPAELKFITHTRTGLSQGRMRTGPCGSPTRRTYGVLGDEVNMAARLMELAASGQILISQHVAEAVGDRYHLRPLGLIRVKGREEAIPILDVLDEQLPDLPRRGGLMTTEPPPELAEVRRILDLVLGGRGQILHLETKGDLEEGGLIAALIDQAKGGGLVIAQGDGRLAGQLGPYAPWQQILRALFALADNVSTAQQIDQVGQWIKKNNPDWELLWPLLGDLLHLPIPDNATTALFDPPLLRQGALFALVMEIVRHMARIQPVLLLLENVELADDISRQLALALARSIALFPIFLVLTHRRTDSPEQPIFPDLGHLPNYNSLTTSPATAGGAIHTYLYRRNEGIPAPHFPHRAGQSVPLVGRDAERSLLQGKLQALLDDGASQVMIIEGEAGIGKSRLIADMLVELQDKDVTSLIGTGDAIEKSTPYYAWRPVFRQLFKLERLPDETSERQRLILAQLPVATQPELRRLAPLLNAVLPLDLPENEFTRQMSGQVRADNSRELMVRLLQQAAARSPLVLILEDAHWLDSASWALAHLVSRAVRPLLLVIVTRSLVDPLPADYRRLLEAGNSQRLSLDALVPEAILHLVCNRLGVKGVPDRVASLIHQKAEGHPFFSEELAYALQEAGLIVVEDGECHLTAPAKEMETITLPDTVEGIITSRIDHLKPAHQLTLKIASVIGRVFLYTTLYDIHPVQVERPHLSSYLETLERLEITLLETPEPDLSYVFKHIITQEVAYNLMVFKQRQQLHRTVARWYEIHRAGDLSPWYPLLAHHWSKANELVKALEYFEKAGEQALHNGAYREALSFFGQALTLAAQSEEVIQVERLARWERYLGEAYLGLGQLVESRTCFERTLAILKQPVPRSLGKTLISLVRQILRQVAHRVLLSRFGSHRLAKLHAQVFKASPKKKTAWLEASRAYEQLTEIYYYANQTISSINAGLRTLNLAERAGASPELARAYANVCLAVGLVPIRPLAEFYSRQARTLARTSKQQTLLAYVLSRTGLYELVIARWSEATKALEQAVDISKNFRDWRQLGESLILLALVDYGRGEFGRSQSLFAELEALGNQTGNVQHQAWGLNGQALYLWQNGEAEQAITMLKKALPLFEVSSDLVTEIISYEMLALAYLRLGKQKQSQEANTAASELIAQTAPTPLSAFADYIGVALVYLTLWERSQDGPPAAQKAYAGSARRACRVLQLYVRLFPVGQPRLWLTLGLYHWLSGKSGRAHRAWRKSLSLSEGMAMPYEQGLAHYEIGRHLALDDPARQHHLALATGIFSQLEAPHDLALVQNALGERRTTASGTR